MKKLIALLLAVMMLVTLVACTEKPADTTTKAPVSSNDNTEPNNDQTEANPQEIKTVNWVTVDGKPTNYDSWVAKVNAYTGEKIGVHIEMQYVDGETLTMMYQTGADWDIMFGEGGSRIDDAYAVGALAPLDDLLANAPGLTNLIPSFVFDAVKINGQIYAIPAYKDISHSEYFIWEKAVVDEYYPEYTEVHTLADLYEAVKTIKERGCDWQSLMMAGAFSNGIPTWDYDGFTTGVGIKFEGGTEFVSTFETEEFKADLEVLSKLYHEGYFNSDNYVLDSTDGFSEYVVGNGWGWPSAADTAWKRDGRTVVVSQYKYTTVSTGSVRGSYLMFNAMSDVLPEAIKFIEFLNTDTYLRDLYWYGEEGLNWDYIEEDGVKKVHRYGDADGVENWTGAAYRQGSFFNVTPQEGTIGYGEIQELNENAVASAAMGFTLNKEPIQAEISAVDAVWAQYEKMIMCGVQIDLIDEAVEAMYAAGLQTIIDETNRQFKEWQASNG